MKPEVELLGISIKTFGVVFALGFLASGALVARRLRELGKPIDWAYEIAFAALIGGVVGARVYYVVQNYGQVRHDLWGSMFSGSGLVWYGGAIGGAVAVLTWMRWRAVLELRMFDACATALALGYAIGRIGSWSSSAATRRSSPVSPRPSWRASCCWRSARCGSPRWRGAGAWTRCVPARPSGDRPRSELPAGGPVRPALSPHAIIPPWSPTRASHPCTRWGAG
jgi:prolipoprotein diacylglyceryltransferase